jgi:hypothetical protein
MRSTSASVITHKKGRRAAYFSYKKLKSAPPPKTSHIMESNSTTQNLEVFPDAIVNSIRYMKGLGVSDTRQDLIVKNMMQRYHQLIRDDLREELTPSEEQFARILARAHTRTEEDIQIALMHEHFGCDLTKDHKKKRAFIQHLYGFIHGKTPPRLDEQLDAFLESYGKFVLPGHQYFSIVLRMDWNNEGYQYPEDLEEQERARQR